MQSQQTADAGASGTSAASGAADASGTSNASWASTASGASTASRTSAASGTSTASRASASSGISAASATSAVTARAGRLQGKSALITGGGGGIGAATAGVFCAEGASVMLVDASEEGLAKTAAALRAAYPEARVLTCTADVSNADLARSAVAQAVEGFGGLDILVNNAAMRNYDALADVTPAAWQAMVAVNLIGPSNYIAAALPALRASGKGSVVTVSSCYAVTGRKGMGLYDTTKAGLLAMTRTLACEEAAHGVRANALCPGSTLTDFHVGRAQASGKSVDVLKTQRQDTSMLGRWASPEEIAWPILWLASDEASFITGATLMVDGGLSAM